MSNLLNKRAALPSPLVYVIVLSCIVLITAMFYLLFKSASNDANKIASEASPPFGKLALNSFIGRPMAFTYDIDGQDRQYELTVGELLGLAADDERWQDKVEELLQNQTTVSLFSFETHTLGSGTFRPGWELVIYLDGDKYYTRSTPHSGSGKNKIEKYYETALLHSPTGKEIRIEFMWTP